MKSKEQYELKNLTNRNQILEEDLKTALHKIGYLESELRIAQSGEVADKFVTITRYLCLSVVLIVGLNCGVHAVEALAGKQTLSNIGFGFVANSSFAQLMDHTLAALGLVYGLNERRLRKNKVKDIGVHLTELERKLDPKRTSSNLTETGDTNPEDK